MKIAGTTKDCSPNGTLSKVQSFEWQYTVFSGFSHSSGEGKKTKETDEVTALEELSRKLFKYYFFRPDRTISQAQNQLRLQETCLKLTR